MDVDGFLADLASSAPVPGGGSVAALQVAMGAALVEMVCNLTIGRKKYQSVEAEATQIRTRALAVRERARQLVDEDAAAYGAVSEAMRLPRGTEQETAARTAAVQDSLKGAASHRSKPCGVLPRCWTSRELSCRSGIRSRQRRGHGRGRGIRRL